MKKILAMLMMMLLIGCSNGEKREENALEGKIYRLSKTLYTPEEIKESEAGKKIPVVFIDDNPKGLVDGVFYAMTLLQSTLKFDKVNDDEIEATMKAIIKDPTAIYISYNTDTLIEAIEDLGKTEEGKEALKQGRFGFINEIKQGIGYVGLKEVMTLSDKYGFRYSYVE